MANVTEVLSGALRFSTRGCFLETDSGPIAMVITVELFIHTLCETNANQQCAVTLGRLCYLSVISPEVTVADPEEGATGVRLPPYSLIEYACLVPNDQNA